MRDLNRLALAALFSLASTAQARPPERDHAAPSPREGTPPRGSIRGEITLRAAQDGRGDSDDHADRARATPGETRVRPDSSLGQERHFALPIKSGILLRVSLGDGDESARSVAQARPDAASSSSRPDSSLGQERHVALPIKSSIQLRVNLGDGRESARSSAPSPAGAAHRAWASRSYSDQQLHSPPGLTRPLPSWMLVKMMNEGYAMFDDPKIDRLNVLRARPERRVEKADQPFSGGRR